MQFPTAWLYVITWTATLADQLGGLAVGGQIAGAAILLFLALEMPRQRAGIRWVVLALSAAGAAAVLACAHPWPVAVTAARRGAGYAAFFFALGTLRVAAEASASVRRCGAQLVAQPARRRILALLAGGHVFGIILSYGAIDLLGAMLGQGLAPGQVNDPARRGMMLSVFRGFVVMNCWSPLNIMTVVVSAAVPGADLPTLVPLAFLAAMAMVAAAWWQERNDTGLPTQPGVERWTIHLRIIALVGLVMLLAGAVGTWFGVTLSTGVTVAVPAVALVWIAVQERRLQGPTGVLHRIAAFYRRIPGFRGEAAVLVSGGFLGVALGAALPPGGAGAFGPVLPPLLVALLVPAVMTGAGVMGLNPIALVAVIGAAIPNPAALGLPAPVLAFACMLGWGVAVGLTPMSASAIATARWTGSDPWTVALGWNRRYTMQTLGLAWLAITVLYFWLTRGQP